MKKIKNKFLGLLLLSLSLSFYLPQQAFAALCPAQNSCTGASNPAGTTMTWGGNTSFVGAHSFEGILQGNTSVIFPVYGTLATDMQSAYNNGVEGDIALSSNKPFVISEAGSSAANAIVTQSTGTNTVANYRVMGWTFVPASNITVTALQYDDAHFTQSGARQCGIYKKSDESLVVTAYIAKTDPLDSTTKYRTQPISPVTLSAATDYVYSCVVAANEANWMDSNAVPVAGVSITQWATGAASSSPISLSYPTNFTSTANTVFVGSFQLSSSSEFIAVNDITTNPSQIFNVVTTSRASHSIPSMTAAERDAIASPAVGDEVFVTDNDTFYFWNGDWTALATSSGVVSSVTGTADQILVNGTNGTPQTGSLTVTLPQAIATTSTPQFNTVILDGVGASLKMQDNTAGAGQAYNPINWYGVTSTSAETQYARIIPTIVSNTNGAMTSRLGLYVQDAGTLSQYLNIDGSLQSIELLKNLDGSTISAEFNTLTVNTPIADVVYQSDSYPNPSFISSLDAAKLTGTLPTSVQSNIDRLDTLTQQFNSTAQPVHIRSSVSGTQNILNNTPTAVGNLWDGVVKNQGDISYSGGTYTVGSAGLYFICAQFSFPASTTGVREIYFTINGNGTYALQTQNGAASGIPTRLFASMLYPLAANDTVQVWVYQTSTATQAVGGGNLDSGAQFFSMVKLF